MEKNEIYKDIKDIVDLYAFEFNTQDTRKEIGSRILDYLSSIGAFPQLVDRTTPEMADRGEIRHMISFMGAEMSLDEYLNTILE